MIREIRRPLLKLNYPLDFETRTDNELRAEYIGAFYHALGNRDLKSLLTRQFEQSGGYLEKQLKACLREVKALNKRDEFGGPVTRDGIPTDVMEQDLKVFLALLRAAHKRLHQVRPKERYDWV